MEVLEKILAGDPAKDIREETIRFLPNLVDDNATRQYLYRLSLLFHSFDEELALAVANVEPAVPLPAEKLVELHGPWLSRTQRGTFEVSPLLRGSGELNLAADLRESVHAIAADVLLTRSPIPADQVHNIALHLFASNQGNRLAVFLVQALMKVETKSQAEYFDWAAGLFLKDAPKQIHVSPIFC